MKVLILALFLPLVTLHLWLICANFVAPTAKSGSLLDNAIHNYVAAPDQIKALFWLTSAGVLMLAAALQLTV